MELSFDTGALSAADHWAEQARASGTEHDGYIAVRCGVSGRFRDEDAVKLSLESYLDHELARAVLPVPDVSERIELIRKWEPQTPNQRAFKDNLHAQFLRDAGESKAAIELGETAWRDDEHYGAAVIAAECMMRVELNGDAPQNNRAIGRAREFALSLRDRRRSLGMPSANAVEIAMHASALLGDTAAALRVAMAAPEGEATIGEASAPLVYDEATVLLAETGQLERAAGRLSEATAPTVRHQVAALLAANDKDEERARSEWSEAIRTQDDFNLKAVLTARAAASGHLDSFVEEVAKHAPEVAAEIRQIAAIAADDEQAILRATADFGANRRIGHTLIRVWARRENWARVATLAERAADLWGDPDDWMRAAEARRRLDERGTALDLAIKAILQSGDRWGGLAGAHMVAIELACEANEWSTAIHHANALVGLQPESLAAQWAVVKTEFYWLFPDDGVGRPGASVRR